MRQTLIQK